MLTPAEAGQVFLAPVTVGNQSFEVVVDTGSSDPWLVASGYTCYDLHVGAVDSTDAGCAFGPAYQPSLSSSYSVDPDMNFNISYADGESLQGAMAYAAWTLGGISIPKQEFGLVTHAAWYGDGLSSGLVGLAYSSLTSAYTGTNPAADVGGSTQPYNPLFANMYTTQGVAPLFSLAISRDPTAGGVLALGGIPAVPHSPYFAHTPLQSVGVDASSGTRVYQFYSILTGGFAYSPANASARFTTRTTAANSSGGSTPVRAPNTSVIVDSGTSLCYLPDAVAAGINAAFDPPAVVDEGIYTVDCGATAPVFGVVVNDKIFYVNALDLIVPIGTDRCVSGVQADFGGLAILGDVWMKNVVAVFDVGNAEMAFAARQFYDLT